MIMKNANFYMPTQVRFGTGRLEELKDILPVYGKRGLLVSRPRWWFFEKHL